MMVCIFFFGKANSLPGFLDGQNQPLSPSLTGSDLLLSQYVLLLSHLSRYHTPARSAGLLPMYASTLINGLGRYSGGPQSPLAIINVSPGVRYRFRLVSMSCDPNYVFSIDGHNMVKFLPLGRLYTLTLLPRYQL
jgi:hypothetical protein